MNNIHYWIEIALCITSGIFLIRYLAFKRKVFKLREDMKQHHQEHGCNEELWKMFIKRTNPLFKFWS
ncbi:hypothetical protein H735_09215 [Vibrio owensii CAIM 1854 = LMG 25443]|uniref:Uncharacterized protein n=1 Tax=Vibrio owensii CAIM 1854 = LMG 25443 TaxID=1229493 RepID=A0A0C1ZIQ8_9VIBR|nr:hypothetical protein H735_09215 [Vibrio owensii CAIM 1854 = LMG 25443]